MEPVLSTKYVTTNVKVNVNFYVNLSTFYCKLYDVSTNSLKMVYSEMSTKCEPVSANLFQRTENLSSTGFVRDGLSEGGKYSRTVGQNALNKDPGMSTITFILTYIDMLIH